MRGVNNAILVVNAGSSSLKFSIFAAHSRGELELLSRGLAEGLYTAPHFVAKDADGALLAESSWSVDEGHGHDVALQRVIAFVHERLGDYRLAGVGHRVVHGGPEFAAPVRVNAAILSKLEQFIPLAPLHQPHNLAPIRALLERSPSVPQIACFDTAFHRHQPPIAQAYALPPSITDRGVLRYGFHGLSYEYIASVLPSVDARAAGGRTVVLHLGNGASMCAMSACTSVATTMGFSTLDGLPMGTRCGALDPGVVLYLLDELQMTVRDVHKLLYEQSGLLGVSGISSDMRTLEASSDPRARLAIELFSYRINRELGSLAAALGGLDAIVFTAGIGENSAALRARVCEAAAWIGVAFDPAANSERGTDGVRKISASTSGKAVWVVPTNEELMIARHTSALLGPG